MSYPLIGGLLGLGVASGSAIVLRSSPPMRPIRLADRIAPYLTDRPRPSALLAKPVGPAVPFAVVRRLAGPSLVDATRLLERLVGGAGSVRRRLRGLGSAMTVEEFRIEQVIWAAVGTAGGGVLLAGGGAARGQIDPVLVAAAAMCGAVGGVLSRDWWLTRQLSRRERAMLTEFPVVADLLALAVVAGEAPTEALARVVRLTRGELAHDLSAALATARSGTAMATALRDLATSTTFEPFARFLSGFAIAIERGTPLAQVLRAQAADVRELSKRMLLEAAGKKEISMMLPVVFLILPVTVLFALYPGLLTLTSIAR